MKWNCVLQLCCFVGDYDDVKKYRVHLYRAYRVQCTPYTPFLATIWFNNFHVNYKFKLAVNCTRCAVPVPVLVLVPVPFRNLPAVAGTVNSPFPAVTALPSRFLKCKYVCTQRAKPFALGRLVSLSKMYIHASSSMADWNYVFRLIRSYSTMREILSHR